MHYVILSETPMARQTCRCEAEDNHWAGEEISEKKPSARSVTPTSSGYLTGFAAGVRAEKRRRHYIWSKGVA